MDLYGFMTALADLLVEEGPPPGPSRERANVEIPEWGSVVAKIIDELKKKPRLMEKFKSFRDGTPYFVCLLNDVTVKKMILEYVAKCKQEIKMGSSGKKNTTKATSIRLLGNSLFVKKEYVLAFKMYSRGLMFAKDEDEEAPLLYANRSAVYFYLKEYENALEDTERALKFGYENLKPVGKLLIRKGFSLLALGRDAEVKEILDANMPASEDEPDFAQWQQLKTQSANVNRQIIKRDITLSQFQDISKISTALTNNEIFRPHERFPWLNAKIDLCFDAVKGYSLVSKEEMKYGEIVALSKPFISLDPKRDSTERCHYCMVPCFESPKYFSDKAKALKDSKLSSDSLRMGTPFPCSECSNVLYCSEACRTAAWSAFHRFECSQMTILAKMGIKDHLALRMLYRVGTLDPESAGYKIVSDWAIHEDHLALMVNQEAYPFIYMNPRSSLAVEKMLKMILTICIHLKLLQMSNLLSEPNNDTEVPEYLHKASIAYNFLMQHLTQVEVNESVPFTDHTTSRTIMPSPFLFVDGMTAIMKHSCEATVASSTLLSESLGSTVKLLFATGGVPAGTVLTLAYNTEESVHFEALNRRKWHLYRRYDINCACGRCLRESRDSLDASTGVYYPIACSLCGGLMIREEEGDGSYRCSSTDGCTFKYSAQQMKNVYEQVEKLMEAKRNIELCTHQMYSTFHAKAKQLKNAIKSSEQLLYRGSLLLAQLYSHLACCYLLITMVPTSNHDSVSIGEEINASTHIPQRGRFTTALLYINKALDILENLKQLPAAKTLFAGEFAYTFDCLERTKPLIFGPLFYEMLPSISKVECRYDNLLKVTAFDTMVVSSLAAKK